MNQRWSQHICRLGAMHTIRGQSHRKGSLSPRPPEDPRKTASSKHKKCQRDMQNNSHLRHLPVETTPKKNAGRGQETVLHIKTPSHTRCIDSLLRTCYRVSSTESRGLSSGVNTPTPRQNNRKYVPQRLGRRNLI